MTSKDNKIIKDEYDGWVRYRRVFSGGKTAYISSYGKGENGEPWFFSVAVRFPQDARMSPKDYSISRILLTMARYMQESFPCIEDPHVTYDRGEFLPYLENVGWGVRSTAPKVAEQGDVSIEIFAVIPGVYKDRTGVVRGLYTIKPGEDGDCVDVSGKIMRRRVIPAKITPAEDTCPTTMFLAKQYEVRASLTDVAYKDDKVVPLHVMLPLGKIYYQEAKEAAEMIHYEMVSGRINVDKSYVALCEAVHRGGEEVTGTLYGNLEGRYTVKAELVGDKALRGLLKSMVLTLSHIEPRKGSSMPLEVKSRVISLSNGYDLQGRISPEDCAAYSRAVLAFHAESLGYDEGKQS